MDLIEDSTQMAADNTYRSVRAEAKQQNQTFARNNSSLWPHNVGSFLSIRQCTTPQVNINQEPQSLWIDKN